MKQIISILIIIILIFITCKENEPTAPEDETPKSEILAEATLGSEGGILETEDFKLTIPSGAFDNSVQLRLFTDDTASSSVKSVSPHYLIEGMPSSFNEPLEIRIKNEKTLNGLTLLKYGMMQELNSFDTTLTMMNSDLCKTTEENGFVIAQIPALKWSEGNLSKMKAESPQWEIEIFTDCSIITSDHFELWSEYYDFSMNPNFYNTLIDYFEQAYSRFEKLNFDLISYDFSIPIFPTSTYSYSPFSIYNDELGSLKIRLDQIVDLNQNRYQIDYAFAKSFLFGSYLMPESSLLCHGIARWSTYKYEPNYMLYGLGSSFRNSPFYYSSFIGKDCSALLIDYIADKKGEEELSKIAKTFLDSWGDEIGALEYSIGPVGEWLTEYYMNLLTGYDWDNKFKGHLMWGDDFWERNAVSVTMIDNNTDEVNWTENFEDLSAKLFRVQLATSLSETNNLIFSVDGGDCEIALYKFKNKEFERISDPKRIVTLSKIKEMADNGYEIYVLIVNKYLHTALNENSSVTLKIEKTSIPKVTNVRIHVENIEVNKRFYKQDGSYSNLIDTLYWSHYDTNPEPIPTFEDNIFYQAYSYTNSEGSIYSGNFSVKFDETMENIVNFSVYKKEDRSKLTTMMRGTSEYGISGEEIPRVSSGDFDLYEVIGLEVCEKLNNNIKGSVDNQTQHWEIISINACRTEDNHYPSRLWIEVYKE